MPNNTTRNSKTAKIISFYSHKGGVGKTTSVLNTAVCLEKIGYNVLLIDADPQCSLTGLVMKKLSDTSQTHRNDIYEYLDQPENKTIYTNIYDCFKYLQDPFKHLKSKKSEAHSSLNELEKRAIDATKKLYRPQFTNDKSKHRDDKHRDDKHRDGIYFLPGNREFYSLEKEANNAYDTLALYGQVKTDFHTFFTEMGKKLKIDFILLDLNPGATKLNQILLMGSDYFAIPAMPDHFSKLSLQTLSTLFEDWAEKQAKEKEAFEKVQDEDEEEKNKITHYDYPNSLIPPKFLGLITQRVNMRLNKPMLADQNWLTLIYNTEAKLTETLKKYHMLPKKFKQYANHIKSFGPMGLTAQDKSLPIVLLKNDKNITNQFKAATYNLLTNLDSEDKLNLQFSNKSLENADTEILFKRKKFITKFEKHLEKKLIDFDWEYQASSFPFIASQSKLAAYFLSKTEDENFKLAAAEACITLIEENIFVRSEQTYRTALRDEVLRPLRKFILKFGPEQDNADKLASQSPKNNQTDIETLLTQSSITEDDLFDLAQFLIEQPKLIETINIVEFFSLLDKYEDLSENEKQDIKHYKMLYNNKKNELIERFKKNNRGKYKKFILEIFSETTHHTLPFIMDDEIDNLLSLLLKDLNVKLVMQNLETNESSTLNPHGIHQLTVLKKRLTFSIDKTNQQDDQHLSSLEDCENLLGQKFDISNYASDIPTLPGKEKFDKNWTPKHTQENKKKQIPEEEEKEPIIIGSFNHKGGVGKTTTTYHLAYTYANAGERVLMIDADPQCNLSSLIMQGDFEFFSNLPEETEEDYFDFYSFLDGVLEKDPIDELVQQTRFYQSQYNENLFLMPSKFDKSSIRIEGMIGEWLAKITDRNLSIKQTLLINAVLKKIASAFDMDKIFIDLSPSISYANQVLLMNTDYFIIPFFPDYQSQQAIISLSTLLPKWHKDMKEIHNLFQKNSSLKKRLDKNLKKLTPKLLAIIPQRLEIESRNRSTGTFTPKKQFKLKINNIYRNANNKLLPKLKECGIWHQNSSRKLKALTGVPDFYSRGIDAQMSGRTVFDVPTNKLANNPGKVRNSQDVLFYQKPFEEIKTEINKQIEAYNSPEEDIIENKVSPISIFNNNNNNNNNNNQDSKKRTADPIASDSKRQKKGKGKQKIDEGLEATLSDNSSSSSSSSSSSLSSLSSSDSYDFSSSSLNDSNIDENQLEKFMQGYGN